MDRTISLAYPATIEKDGRSYLAEASDLEEANGVGATPEFALNDLIASLENVIASRMEDRELVPAPSRPGKNQKVAVLPGLTSAKVALYQAMMEQELRIADLARAMKVDRKIVDRLLDLNHKSRFDQIEKAFAALDCRLVMSLEVA